MAQVPCYTSEIGQPEATVRPKPSSRKWAPQARRLAENRAKLRESEGPVQEEQRLCLQAATPIEEALDIVLECRMHLAARGIDEALLAIKDGQARLTEAACILTGEADGDDL